MKLSVIVPVFNEEKTVRVIIQKLKKFSYRKVKKEIIIVDDGSTDRTAERIAPLVKSSRGIHVLTHNKNKGKGAAIRTGLQRATGDYILIQDADLEYNPSDIPLLLGPVLEKEARVVFGTRINRLPNFRRDERTVQFFIQYLGNKFLSFITVLLYGQWLTDMETGYKLFPRKALSRFRLHARSFDFEPEITAKLIRSGYKIHEVTISTNPRGYAQGKKLKAFRDGVQALYTLLKYRFT